MEDNLWNFFGVQVPEPCEFIRDVDCTVNTAVRYGVKSDAVYGKGICMEPKRPGRRDSEHFRRIYLERLLPLEEYDKIIVLLSGGKDSVACFLKLLELGVPVEKIECWHHDIDGGHPTRRMDWRCTASYVRAFCDAFGVKLRVSYREDGFFGELYRIGASKMVHWVDPDTDEIMDCRITKNQKICEEIRRNATDEKACEEVLKEYGYRMKFPAKSGSLQTRWCSAYLKTMVSDSVMTNLDMLELLDEIGGSRLKFPAKGSTHQGRWCSGALKASVEDSVTSNLLETSQNVKILVISGERWAESATRSRYNEMEIHRTNAEAKKHRLVHCWRPVIAWSEKDVWEIMKRNNVNPHPCYRAGWNRCSCCMCIFSKPEHFAGIRDLYPEEFKLMCRDEEILQFTLDSKKDLVSYVGDAKSCLYRGDHEAIHSLITGEFSIGDVFVKGEWMYPAGAFHGAAGGPC